MIQDDPCYQIDDDQVQGVKVDGGRRRLQEKSDRGWEDGPRGINTEGAETQRRRGFWFISFLYASIVSVPSVIRPSDLASKGFRLPREERGTDSLQGQQQVEG